MHTHTRIEFFGFQCCERKRNYICESYINSHICSDLKRDDKIFLLSKQKPTAVTEVSSGFSFHLETHTHTKSLGFWGLYLFVETHIDTELLTSELLG